jgi:uroporphyrinogen-III synthase
MLSEILVIRQPDVFSSILIEQGFSVINLPLIKTETIADLSELENHLAAIETFDGIFITSAKAAQIVAAKFGEARKRFRGKFFVLGKQSAESLKNLNSEIFFSKQATTAEELFRLIPEEHLQNKRFLFPCGTRSLRIVPETLSRFAQVVETIVYKTVDIKPDGKRLIEIKEKFERERIGAICFFSPSSVEDFLKKFEDFAQGEVKIAAIGQTTAQFIKENNLRADFVSTKPAANDFAFELKTYLLENGKHHRK